jgi:hypothetical protein
MSILRITKHHIDKASKAHQENLRTDPRFRDIEEEKKKLREEAGQEAVNADVDAGCIFLQPAFAVTPLSSSVPNKADIHISGVHLGANWPGSHNSFVAQHANDRVYFNHGSAGSASLNYSKWDNRRRAPHIELYYGVGPPASNKEMAVLFGFNAVDQSRVLIYSTFGKVGDITLAKGDDQFLIVVESLAFSLFFIHVRLPNSDLGGAWFFRGITGYVV